MVVDTSALVAILFDEPDQRRYDEAIAAAIDDTLLFKGDDFSHTDIRPALPPVPEAT